MYKACFRVFLNYKTLFINIFIFTEHSVSKECVNTIYVVELTSIYSGMVDINTVFFDVFLAENQ